MSSIAEDIAMLKVNIAESALAYVMIAEDKHDAIESLESWIKSMKEEADG